MSRRSAVRALAGAGAAMVAVASFGMAGAEHTAQKYTVSVNANFRTGPSTSHSIISVIPKGATLAVNGNTTNGYASINYKGRTGWVYASYIVIAGGGFNPVIVGSARTTTSVHLRTGPDTGTQSLRVVPAGARVDISDTVQNGYRYVVHNGLGGWIYATYLTSPDDQGGNYRTTTARVNLRAEPSTSAKVLTVIPAGARVQLLHSQAGSFLNANYNGLQGWVHKDYLK